MPSPNQDQQPEIHLRVTDPQWDDPDDALLGNSPRDWRVLCDQWNGLILIATQGDPDDCSRLADVCRQLAFAAAQNDMDARPLREIEWALSCALESPDALMRTLQDNIRAATIIVAELRDRNIVRELASDHHHVNEEVSPAAAPEVGALVEAAVLRVVERFQIAPNDDAFRRTLAVDCAPGTRNLRQLAMRMAERRPEWSPSAQRSWLQRRETGQRMADAALWREIAAARARNPEGAHSSE